MALFSFSAVTELVLPTFSPARLWATGSPLPLETDAVLPLSSKISVPTLLESDVSVLIITAYSPVSVSPAFPSVTAAKTFTLPNIPRNRKQIPTHRPMDFLFFIHSSCKKFPFLQFTIFIVCTLCFFSALFWLISTKNGANVSFPLIHRPIYFLIKLLFLKLQILTAHLLNQLSLHLKKLRRKIHINLLWVGESSGLVPESALFFLADCAKFHY